MSGYDYRSDRYGSDRYASVRTLDYNGDRDYDDRPRRHTEVYYDNDRDGDRRVSTQSQQLVVVRRAPPIIIKDVARRRPSPPSDDDYGGGGGGTYLRRPGRDRRASSLDRKTYVDAGAGAAVGAGLAAVRDRADAVRGRIDRDLPAIRSQYWLCIDGYIEILIYVRIRRRLSPQRPILRLRLGIRVLTPATPSPKTQRTLQIQKPRQVPWQEPRATQ
jgi:hypothetical protein